VEEKRGTGKGGIKMSSREEILASIRKHTQTRYEKPDIADMKRLTYPDKIEQFCAISRAVGGTAVVLGEGEDVNAVIRRTYPDAMRIASVLPDISCATFNPDMVDDPKELDGTEVAVIRGEIGVAENCLKRKWGRKKETSTRPTLLMPHARTCVISF
jgi:L-lactate dehydrogenase complex protein LldG